MKRALAALFLLVVAAPGSPARAGDPPSEVPGRYAELRRIVDELPPARIDAARKKALSASLDKSQGLYAKGKPCPAVVSLNDFLRQAQDSRPKDAELYDGLYSRGRDLRQAVQRTASSRDDCFVAADADRPPQVRLTASDNVRFAATVAFGEARLLSLRERDGSYTEVTLPGLDPLTGTPGHPAVPVWRALVALPHGSTPRLRLPAEPVLRERVDLDLYPFQPASVDGPTPVLVEFRNPRFVKDAAAYATNALFPATPCAVVPLGRFRDLELAQVSCAAGRYNPVRERLELYASIAFEITFEGGRGTFLTSQSLSPFENAAKIQHGAVLNREALDRFVEPVDLRNKPCAGEELLILAQWDLLEEAQRLADWKVQKGIATTVVELDIDDFVPDPEQWESSGKRKYAAGIDGLIEERYATCKVRPSYVLIFGDVDEVPVARDDYETLWEEEDRKTRSDLGYAVVNPASDESLDFSIDLAVGRITVNNAVQAKDVVDKIINYESKPPFQGTGADAPFYRSLSFASQFQCCRMDWQGNPFGSVPGVLPGFPGVDQRRYIQTSELIRDQLLPQGYDIQRIYNQTVDGGDLSDPFNLQLAYNGDTTPRRYLDLPALPAELAPGYPWSGGTSEIVDAFNAGRFLFLHRDHGYKYGWVDPPFTTADFQNLSNGELLPVVYSVNCSTGRFDDDGDYTPFETEPDAFIERLLRAAPGGMVGGLAANRPTSTWANDLLVRGFFDATWPQVVPEFEGPATRRLGDVMNHGKLLLAANANNVPGGTLDPSDVFSEFVYWHVFGDPTLEMWTANPHATTLPTFADMQVDAAGVSVGYDAPDGTVITALQVRPATRTGRLALRSSPLGRAVIQQGRARIAFADPPDPDLPIEYSASLENAVSVRIEPRRALEPGR